VEGAGGESEAAESAVERGAAEEPANMLTEEQIRDLVDSQLKALADLDAHLVEADDDDGEDDVFDAEEGAGGRGEVDESALTGPASAMTLLKMERDLDDFLASMEATTAHTDVEGDITTAAGMYANGTDEDGL